MYHGDDKGQGFPTACWGRDAEVTRLVAPSAYKKPTVSTLEEGGNHSCLDWKDDREGTCQAYAVIYHITQEPSQTKMPPGLDKASQVIVKDLDPRLQALIDAVGAPKPPP